MANAISFAQIEQFKRDARRASRQEGISISTCLDRIARPPGFGNWSQLQKHAERQTETESDQEPIVILIKRSLDQMRAAMAIPAATGGSQDDRMVRIQVTDLHEHFRSAEHAVEFAISYMEAVLQVPKYVFHAPCHAYYEMRAWLPYCVYEMEGDVRVLVGRDYRPVGMVQAREPVDNRHFTQCHVYMPEAEVLAHATPDPEHGLGYLYDLSPWSSRQAGEAYLTQLRTLLAWMTKGGATPAVPAASVDARPRHYVHGDRYEYDPTKYYCEACDSMVEGGHFKAEHPETWSQRYLTSLETWLKRPARNRLKWRRAPGVMNALAAEAQALELALGTRHSTFYRWLDEQSERDDPVGDLPGTLRATRSFRSTSRM